MLLIRDIIFSLWQSFVSLVAYFAEKTSAAGIEFSWIAVIILTFVLTVWMISGAWAASIAGSRHRSMFVHFILGMMFPFLYPCIALFSLDVAGAKERAKEKEEEEKRQAEEAARAEAEGGGRSGTEDGDTGLDEGVGPEQFDRDYFTRISRDESGQRTGPWLITYKGIEVEALQIVDALDEVIVLEIKGREDELQRIRIRYSLIESCQHA